MSTNHSHEYIHANGNYPQTNILFGYSQIKISNVMQKMSWDFQNFKIRYKLKIITLNPLGAMTKLLPTFTMWPLECVKSLLLHKHIVVKTADQQQDNKTQSKIAYDHVNQNYRYNTNQHHTSVINAIKELMHCANAQIIFLQNLFNPLNTELNPICHLLILLGDLTFMGTCIIRIFQYISNKTQRYAVYLYLETALHVSGGTSTHYQERIQLYLLHLVFVTPLLLPAAIVEELELV